MERTSRNGCSFNFYYFFPLSNLFHCHRLVLLLSKNTQTSLFLTLYIYLDIFYHTHCFNSIYNKYQSFSFKRFNFFLKTGTDVCYYQNHIKRKGGHYYTASFTITFPHDNDTVHLAYCYPYTYSDLQLYLKELEDDPKRRNRFRRRTMCQTLAGKYKKRMEERASRIWM